MFLFFLKYSVFQNCVCRTQMPSGTGTQTVVPVPMPCDQCPASTTALPCCVFDVPLSPGVSSSPKSMTMVQDMFSAGHLDIALQISHPLPLFTLIPPNYLADLSPLGRFLELAPCVQTPMDSLICSLTVIISIPSSLCLTHFLYNYSLWKTNLIRCGLDKACHCSFNCIMFTTVCWKKKKKKKREKSFIIHVQLILWKSQLDLVQRSFNTELGTAEEKCDGRKSDGSPTEPMWIEMEWGSRGGHLSIQWQSKSH